MRFDFLILLGFLLFSILLIRFKERSKLIMTIQEFVKTWENKGDETADKATYWNTLLHLLGVPQDQIDNGSYIQYEKRVNWKHEEHFHGAIDAYIPSVKVLIEQKSNGVDLFAPEDRPNGGHTEKITPFEQARRYDNNLPANEKANFLVLCNFKQMVVYDVRQSLDQKPVILNLADFPKSLSLLSFLVKPACDEALEKEKQISIEAGNLVSKMHHELLKIFDNCPDVDSAKATQSINMLCVRLVFCLYAEDAGLFNDKEQFYDYLKDVEPNRIGVALKALFEVLDTKLPDRTKDDPFWNTENPKLARFPYVNGGLFRDKDLIIPPFTPELKTILLHDMSRGFDWSTISPTIFGAVFESTLNPQTRRQGGMHYTSVENIHKVIDPLFLNGLKAELNKIKQYKEPRTIRKKARAFQDKLSKLTFLDPACGSGNFLTETFICLRRLENEAIRLETGGESLLDVGQAQDWIKVSIQQFYGIEINDFAVSVAKTALWIAEDQMMKETQSLFYGADWDFLPLKTYTKIHEDNALRVDWNTVLPNYACHYVLGNPPFVGPNLQDKAQKAETRAIIGSGSVDYVANWYYKACDYMQNTKIKCAFVSTSSITQGMQVQLIWQQLFEHKQLQFDFAYRSFKWNNEAKGEAQVYVVIIGFNCSPNNSDKYIYDEQRVLNCQEINAYLMPSKNVFITNRSTPLCTVNKMNKGSQPTDGGHLILSNEEKDELLEKEPQAAKYIKQLLGSREFLHNKKRYCLWLVNINPNELKSMPLVIDRIKAVKKFRLSSKKKATRKDASKPMVFQEIRQPNTNYLLVPRVTSSNRKYVPVGYVNEDIIASDANLVIPNATLYDFSVLESIVHMTWMHIVAGRLGDGYRYSAKIVYNNFPWPSPTSEQKAKIEATAQAILDARKNYPDSSLADLYNPLLMPQDLRKAHKANDKAVLEAYGLKASASDNEIMAKLLKMYQDLVQTKD